MIFETVVKRLPGGLVRLTASEIKQIAGRAGRYRTAFQPNQGFKNRLADETNVGLVTSLEEVDLPYIREAMKVEPPPLKGAGIVAHDSMYHKLAAYFPSSVPFSYLVKRMLDLSEVSPLFFVCEPNSQLENAQIIDSSPGLRVEDQLTFMAAPIYTKDEASRDTALAFATCVARHSDGRILNIAELDLEILEEPVSGSKEYLHGLESLHKSIILYLWLSFRFGGIFTDRTLAAHVKTLVEERMMRALSEFSANQKLRKDASLHRQIALEKQRQEQIALSMHGPGDPDELDLDLADAETASSSSSSSIDLSAGHPNSTYDAVGAREAQTA